MYAFMYVCTFMCVYVLAYMYINPGQQSLDEKSHWIMVEEALDLYASEGERLCWDGSSASIFHYHVGVVESRASRPTSAPCTFSRLQTA